MKKILIAIMALLMLALALTACQEPQGTSTEPNGSDQTPPATTTGADKTPTTEKNQLVKEDYTATLNDFTWVKDEFNADAFDYFGAGGTVINDSNRDHNGYDKTYMLINEDGSSTEVKHAQVRRLGNVGLRITAKDDDAKTVTFEVREVTLRLESAWTEVTAKAGTYLMFNLTTNCPAEFVVTVTAKEGGAANTAAYTQDGIVASGSNGKYTAVAKCTVPYAAGKTYYINICSAASGNPVLKSIPVEITKAKYESPYSLIFQGDWELIRDPNYLNNLIELFYNVYPRVYARFGNGSEPKVITFMADKNYDGVAYNAGTLVCVSTAYANSNPSDIGFFAHEITHAVQQYGGKMYYGSGAWWTEFMADLGRFRYFHWGYSTEFVKIYSMKDQALRSWRYEPYGQHNIFAAYMDSKYPTTKDANGNIKYGLVDSINRLIKASKVELSDDPYKAGTPFNNVVKEITGFETMEALRVQYIKELDEGTWVFKGYRDYLDNFQTEDIPGIPNPTYPMDEPVKKGDITNPILATPVTEGTNLLTGATVVYRSAPGAAKHVFANLFDGDLTTKWQASTPSDKKFTLGDYDHEFILDLGKATTFNTYTFHNASTSERESFNMKEWEIFISDDGVNFTSVDYQKDVNAATVSVNIGTQTARYIMVRIHRADQNNVGTVRLYEMLLLNKE